MLENRFTLQPPADSHPFMTTPTEPTFEAQLVGHRDYLLRFARIQLRNEAWAEDAVSETVLAALAKPQSSYFRQLTGHKPSAS